MILRTSDALQGIGFAVVVPVVFLAGTFVPIIGIQTAVRTIAEYNPLAAIVTAMRQVTHRTASAGSWPLEHPVLATIAYGPVIIAACSPLAVPRLRQAA
jgi:ABC-2 type transport system permease protein